MHVCPVLYIVPRLLTYCLLLLHEHTYGRVHSKHRVCMMSHTYTQYRNCTHYRLHTFIWFAQLKENL